MTPVPWQGRSSTKNVRLLAWLLLLVPVLIAFLYPLAQDYLRAASLLQRIADPHARRWLANYDIHPVEVHDTSFDFRGKPIAARVYLPRGVGFAPGIVVVHGMHELGINEPRLNAFAQSLAASGFFVMTPLVPGIADYRVQGESAEVIGMAVESFSQQLNVPRVGVLALSFSGGLALLAASDPQYANSFAWIASIGGYYDLSHVIRFFASGEAVRPDGTVEHLAPHEYGPLIVIDDEPLDFFSAHDAPLAHHALQLLLSGHGKESEKLTQQMSAAGQQIMQDIYHQERASLAPALLLEIEKRQNELASASPAGRLRFIHLPVLLLHGADDTVIPPTELLWLQRDIPPEYLADALISPAITHVEVGTKIGVRDDLALLHWMALMIQEAEKTSPAKEPSRSLGFASGHERSSALTQSSAAGKSCPRTKPV